MPEYQKAFIGPYIDGHMELKDGFYVPFNPAEISVEEAIGVSHVPQVDGMKMADWMQAGRAMGIQYPLYGSMLGSKKEMTTLSATLFFNTLNDLYQTSYEDVRDDIRKLYPYTNTTEKYAKTVATSKYKVTRKQTKVHQAQQIYFFWGTIAVAGTLTRMSVNYTMFAPDGKPVRAQVSISIEGFYVGEETVTQLPAAKAGSSAGAALSGDLSEWKKEYRGCPNPRMQL
ncbi:MAG: hypothetical protein NC331_08470 [Lachnospiraceae bacterium]|nr:hypothetical protein [Lachnospiraceae bacterium]MCM1239402.1 hypothetical protein [Lachnospiraceae bacterium]